MNKQDNLIVITDSLRSKHRLKKANSKRKDSNDRTLTFFYYFLLISFFSFFIALLSPILVLALFLAIPFYLFLRIAEQQGQRKTRRIPKLRLVSEEKP